MMHGPWPVARGPKPEATVRGAPSCLFSSSPKLANRLPHPADAPVRAYGRARRGLG